MVVKKRKLIILTFFFTVTVTVFFRQLVLFVLFTDLFFLSLDIILCILGCAFPLHCSEINYCSLQNS